MRILVIIGLLTGSVWGTLPEAAPGTFPAGTSYFRNAVWQDSTQIADSVEVSLIQQPRAKFPGKAMLYSLALPGAGQLYARRPLRSAVFLASEIAAVLIWQDYNQRGLDEVDAFKEYADDYWDFSDWVLRASLFGAGWEEIHIGLGGSHSLDYFVDMDEDGWPEIIGASGEDEARLIQLLSDPDTSQHLYPRRDDEYYENIGKYNEFFSGWDDSDPSNPDIVKKKSGLIARSPHRNAYLKKRELSNQLRSTASYAISAIMFNHVVSAIDAIFITAEWNRAQGIKLESKLMFDPTRDHGIGGISLSVAW